MGKRKKEETKAARLRNLMSPLLNYFWMIQYGINKGHLTVEESSLIHTEKGICLENIDEIRTLMQDDSTFQEDPVESTKRDLEKSGIKVIK